MNRREGKICPVIKEEGPGELFAKTFERLADAVRSLQRRLGGGLSVRYDASASISGIFKSPLIQLDVSQERSTRLNVILPHLHKEKSFAGIRCAMELAYELSGHYRNIRFVSLSPIDKDDLYDVAMYVKSPSDKNIEIISLSGNKVFPCHKNEIVLCTLWWTVLIWEAYAEVLEKAGFKKNPFYYLIQDFEPGFYPFGCEYAMARRTYSYQKYTNAIFNSQELRNFFSVLSISFEREYAVKPSLDADIFQYLQRSGYMLKPKDRNKMHILIYGRREARNCLTFILEGLYGFFNAMPAKERERYSVVSAGENMPNIVLMPGVVIRSAGKLPMEQYIGELERAHIGISFMESPHPSFPPLEMALFGLYTITNKFFRKDLSQDHPLIHSVDYPVPGELVRALKKATDYVERAEAGGTIARLPDTVSPLSWRENLSTVGITPVMSANALQETGA